MASHSASLGAESYECVLPDEQWLSSHPDEPAQLSPILTFYLKGIPTRNASTWFSERKKCAKGQCKCLIPISSPYNHAENVNGVSHDRARQKSSKDTRASVGSKRARDLEGATLQKRHL